MISQTEAASGCFSNGDVFPAVRLFVCSKNRWGGGGGGIQAEEVTLNPKP